MTTAVTNQSERQVARPLNVLVPLIRQDIQDGEAAANQAGMPYFKSAGTKMLEAKEQMKHGEFKPWLKRNFNRSYEQCRVWMRASEASQKTGGPVFSSLNELTGDVGRSRPTKRTWHEDVQGNIERARREAERLREEDLSRAEERNAQRSLALRLIDIGFKVLSKELHPDKGGSRDAMRRLNDVRDRLRKSA